MPTRRESLGTEAGGEISDATEGDRFGQSAPRCSRGNPVRADDPSTACVGLITVGILGGVSFLAGSFCNPQRPDFGGTLFTEPYATWGVGLRGRITWEPYHADYAAALDTSPSGPVAAIRGAGMKAIARVCQADPT